MASFVLFLVTSLLIVVNAAKLPATWKTCKRSLPEAEYAPCIKSAVMDAIEELIAKGAPSLGIPPIEPLRITALDIGQGTGPVAVDMKFRDLELGNLDSFEIIRTRHKDAEKYQFGADLILKKPLTVKAKYELHGKVLVLPIKGKGDCLLSFDNLRASMDLSGVPFKKREEEYMNVTKMDIKFETDKLHVKFDNLFDGNKELGDNMNVFLNENWDVILKELKPAVVQAIAAAFQAISNQVFGNVPYNKIVYA